VYHIFKCRYESHPLNCRAENNNKVHAKEKEKVRLQRIFSENVHSRQIEYHWVGGGTSLTSFSKCPCPLMVLTTLLSRKKQYIVCIVVDKNHRQVSETITMRLKTILKLIKHPKLNHFKSSCSVFIFWNQYMNFSVGLKVDFYCNLEFWSNIMWKELNELQNLYTPV
jgi:hypothetical protein